MKKSLFLIAVVLCSCLNAFSQATSLTIDCQTPGWLSSKINYGDQLTVESLTVTGYLNRTDLTFIGTLIEKSLKTIDLTDIVYTQGNTLPSNMFNISPWSDGDDFKYKLNKIALPINVNSPIENKTNVGCFDMLFCDTVIVGSAKCHKITNRFPAYGSSAKHWILREGVDSIMKDGMSLFENAVTDLQLFAKENSVHSVSLPSTLKYIGENAFANCKNMSKFELPQSVEEIEKCAFKGSSWNPDTIILPKSLKSYYMNATDYEVYSDYSKPVVFYFPENIEYIDNTYLTIFSPNNSIGYLDLTPPAEIHVKASVPPTVNYSYYKIFENTNVYIPKGTLDSYKMVVPWDTSNLIEECLVESISIKNGAEINFKRIGSKKQLVATILPEDADNKNVIWKSGNTAICTVSNTGLVTATGEGTTPVTVTTVDGGKTAVCTVNVTPTDHTTITMGSNGIATFSDEDAIDFTSVSGVKAYIASGYNPATGDLTMTRVYKVPAGEGLLVKGAAGSYEVPYEETSAYYANLLVGVSTAMTVNPTDGDYTNFILANDEVKGIGFYPLTSAGEIGANKAYLQLPTSILPAASRSLRMVFEDEEDVTGIKDLNEKGAMSARPKDACYQGDARNEKFFDLQGRRVVKPTRGLYIKDGKKIMVK